METDLTDHKEFDRFFQEEIEPAVDKLDHQRIKVRNTAILIFLGGACGWLLNEWAFIVTEFNTTIFSLPLLAQILLFLLPILFGVLFSVAFIKRNKKFLKTYKKNILEPVLKYMHGNALYVPDKGISKETVMQTGLFKKPSEFTSEDHITFQFENTEIEVSDLSFTWDVRKKKVYTKGQFLTATTHFTPASSVKVYPAGDVLWELKRSGEIVDLESGEFESCFDVRGDQIESRRILTPLVMHQLLKLRERLGQTPVVAYIDKKLYMFVPFNRNMFEPTIFRKLRKEDVKEYVEDIRTFLEIVHILNLNREYQPDAV